MFLKLCHFATGLCALDKLFCQLRIYKGGMPMNSGTRVMRLISDVLVAVAIMPWLTEIPTVTSLILKCPWI